MPSFDVHQHLWPPPVIDALRRRRDPPRLDGDVLELEEGRFPTDLAAHRLDDRLALLDRDGVDVAVVSLQPTLDLDAAPELAEAFHEGMAQVSSAADGRLRAFAAGRCLPGFAGACVPAGALLEGLDALPGELEQAGQSLFVHPGPPGARPHGSPDWWASIVDYGAQMQAAYLAWISGGAQRHPELPVVFAVLAGGAPIQLERLQSRGVEAEAVLHRCVYLDTASYGRRALELVLASHGLDQIVYGSDVPVVDPRPTLEALKELGEPAVRAARSDNPTRLFL
jgi:predicted TIM-barrel fold metal-dependent hydrolase